MTAAIAAAVVGLGGTAHADDPGWSLDLSGLRGLEGLSSAPGDWSKAVETPAAAAAAAPASKVEAPAPPIASTAQQPVPAAVQLPSTGTGNDATNVIARVAAILAAVGFAFAGAGWLTRSRRLLV